MAAAQQTVTEIRLPSPVDTGGATVARALAERRSVRDFARRPLTLEHVSTLLWAAQGRRGHEGHRTAPSAGALYPLEVWLAAGDVEGLPAGVYRYRPGEPARLTPVSSRDVRSALARSAARQTWIEDAPAVLVLVADVSVTAAKYGSRARRYVWMEGGAAAENVYLQATALGLGTVLVGAFDDGVVARVLGLPDHLEPLALMPAGRP